MTPRCRAGEHQQPRGAKERSLRLARDVLLPDRVVLGRPVPVEQAVPEFVVFDVEQLIFDVEQPVDVESGQQ